MESGTEPFLNRPPSYKVESLSKFEGLVNEDVQWFIDHKDRVAISE